MKKYIIDAVERIRDHIDRYPLDKKKTRQLISDILPYVGRNRLQKSFRDYTGYSIRQYERKKCLEKAALALTDDNHTIKKVARLCSYSDQSSFARAFKNMHGLAPKEWLRRYHASRTIISGPGLPVQQTG